MYPALVNAAQILARRPLRLALGAAATAATAAVVAGVAAGPAPATITAGSDHLASYASAVAAPRQAGHWSSVAPASATAAATTHSAAAQQTFPFQTAGTAQQHASSHHAPSAQQTFPFQTAGTAQQGASSAQAPGAQPATAVSPTAAPAAQPSAPAAPQPPPQPYTVYDSVTPSALPSSSQAVAVYADGNYAASPSQVGHRGLVLWIDTNASDTHANVLDVEPGDATPSQAATWVQQKLDGSPNSTAIIYTMKSDWGAVQSAVNALPWWMPSHTRYWIADPTGVPHLVPGSQATQWYWGQNYDMSMAAPNF